MDATKEDFGNKAKGILGALEEKTSEAIRQQISNIRAYKNMDSELLKLRAFIIGIPVIFVALSIFFGDRIKDIMAIDVLRTEIEHLQEDMKSSQLNGLPAGSSVCSPGDETCCSSEEGFFSC